MSHYYTKEELLGMAILDLVTDLACAERDGLTSYAEECRTKLAVLRSADPNTVDIDKVLRS